MEINEEIKKRTRKLKKTNLGASRLAQESKMNLSSNERAHAARLSAGRDTPFPAQLIYTMIKLISVNDEYNFGMGGADIADQVRGSYRFDHWLRRYK